MYKRINRGWNKTTNLWIIFAAMDDGPVGHAMVIAAQRDGQKGVWKNIEGFGLYPKERSPKLLFGRVPGHVVAETLKSIRKSDYALAVGSSVEMYNYAVQNMRAEKDYVDEYSLYKKNCVHFVDQVARAISLTTPSPDLELPSAYLKSLIQLNN